MKTKIVCTIGPATSSEESIEALCLSGMNVARMNFSHNTHKEHLQRINTVKRVRERLSLPIAVMLDTKGPEYRIGCFEKGQITLCDGDNFIFTTKDIVGDESRVSVSYKRLASSLSVGDIILLANGLLSFEVVRIEGEDILCKVTNGGVLSDRKSMSFPKKSIEREYLSTADKEDILFGVENGVDFIACSFVSRASDLSCVRKYLDKIGHSDVEIIAKIENQSGVDAIEEILDECGGVMIARGDMGVEIPFEHLPAIQKSIISACRKKGKCVIIATEMLESMITNPRPTRAEISDVANAVYDGASAIMLSGETAVGEFAIESVKAMARIAKTAEENIHYDRRFKNSSFNIGGITDALSHSTCSMAIELGARAIVACTLSGKTANMVSRFRPPIEIIGLTTDEKTARRMALSFGVIPKVSKKVGDINSLFDMATELAVKTFSLVEGDKIIITAGGGEGTSTIKAVEIKKN